MNISKYHSVSEKLSHTECYFCPSRNTPFTDFGNEIKKIKKKVDNSVMKIKARFLWGVIKSIFLLDRLGMLLDIFGPLLR